MTNKTELLDRVARDGEERLLLARALDKLEAAGRRNIPTHTPFLSPGERAAVEGLLNAAGHPAHCFWGGFPGAERTVCAFLPDWLEGEAWQADPALCPVRALRCTWSGAELSHRDFLGAVLGLGLDREKVGDFLVGQGRCDLLALEEAADFLLLHLDQAGRARLRVEPIPPGEAGPSPGAHPVHPGHRQLSAAGRGGRRRGLPVPGEGRRAHLLGQGAAQSPGVRQARPAGGGRGRAQLPGPGKMRPQAGGRPLQEGAYHDRNGAICVMEQSKIERINALAKKAKSPEGLTPQEMVERDLLRQEYIAAYRNNLVAQLENTYIVEPDGTKHRLGKKP